jgi:hypothetical protein
MVGTVAKSPTRRGSRSLGSKRKCVQSTALTPTIHDFAVHLMIVWLCSVGSIGCSEKRPAAQQAPAAKKTVDAGQALSSHEPIIFRGAVSSVSPPDTLAQRVRKLGDIYVYGWERSLGVQSAFHPEDVTYIIGRGTDSVPFLIELLHGTNEVAVGNAAYCLEEIGSRESKGVAKARLSQLNELSAELEAHSWKEELISRGSDGSVSWGRREFAIAMLSNYVESVSTSKAR